MTIFARLKYPISTPPTKDQLAALPKYFYRIWVKVSLGLDDPHINTTPENIAEVLKMALQSSDEHLVEQCTKALSRLRDAILLLDE